MRRRTHHPARICVYLSVDANSLTKYFNPNDPAPLQYRQLSHDFQEYLDTSIQGAGRNTLINYKVFCGEGTGMRFLVDPLMRTIKRHYSIRQKLAEGKFKTFKRRNYMLLLVNFIIVMICQGLLPLLFDQQHRIHSTLSNALDVFSWVILWKPIERLIFYWNPFLKDILLYSKMAKAEVILIDNEQELINYHLEHSDAA
jgi:hypothetical protein